MSSQPAVALDNGRRLAVRSVSRSHLGHVRPINEDRVFDDAASGVWAVIDGMGGHSGGDIAAQSVIDHLRAACASALPGKPPQVRQALTAANAAVYARNERLHLQAGATLVTATLADDMLEIAWAGDSRAYHIRGGRVDQLSHDHSTVQELVDAGLLTRAMAAHHPQANVVTRALGIEEELPLDSIEITAARHRILLCSDGLSRTLVEAELTIEQDLDQLADHLLARALERDGTDNISLVLIDLEQKPAR